MKRVALLLHCDKFEGWFERVLGFNKDSYLETYRNDWSWVYADGLQENGIEIIIYIPSLYHCGIYETKDNFKVRFLPLLQWYRIVDKLPFFKRFSIGTYLQELINTLAFIDSLEASLQEDEVSLLYIQEYWTTRFDVLIDRLHIPIIGADHGSNDSLAIKSNKKKSLPKAYKLTCQTEEELEQVKGYGGDAILLPNGVDTEFYCPSLTEKQNADKVIFTVSRLTERQKRTSDLIRALVHLDSTWNLEIAGTGPDLKFLQDLAAKLQVSERVRFLGFVKDKSELRTRYRKCSVFALPSAWEALAMVVLEAMSCEAGVVTTDIIAFNSLVFNERSGIKVPVGNPVALAQGILKCYTNRAQYGKEARNLVVEHFSKKRNITQLGNIIKASFNER